MKNTKKIVILTTLAALFLSGAGCANIKPQPVSFDFEKTGNIAKDNPGMEPDIWNLIFEEPGSPALSVSLIFSENSVCIINNAEKPCAPATLEQGARAKVSGKNTEGVVIVTKMTILK